MRVYNLFSYMLYVMVSIIICISLFVVLLLKYQMAQKNARLCLLLQNENGADSQ